MAKHTAAVEDTPRATKVADRRDKFGRSIFRLTLLRIADFLNLRRDRNIERFITARGGVITDVLDRELSGHFGRM